MKQRTHTFNMHTKISSLVYCVTILKTIELIQNKLKYKAGEHRTPTPHTVNRQITCSIQQSTFIQSIEHH